MLEKSYRRAYFKTLLPNVVHAQMVAILGYNSKAFKKKAMFQCKLFKTKLVVITNTFLSWRMQSFFQKGLRIIFSIFIIVASHLLNDPSEEERLKIRLSKAIQVQLIPI